MTNKQQLFNKENYEDISAIYERIFGMKRKTF
jgi:hypothetical protein